MNIETIKETVNTSKYIGVEKKKFLVEGEINVPDIKPDILSIVNVTENVFINNKEITDNKIKIDGTANIYIIYLSDDETSSLRSITSTFNFTEYVDLFGITEESFIKLKCETGALECKVVNNRKINIKLPINIEINASTNCKYDISKDIVNNKNIELKKERMNLKTLVNCKCENINVNEEVNLPEENKPIGEILQASMDIVSKDYKTSYNKILAKAEVIIKLIYISDDDTNMVETFETKIPVMGFIDVDGLTENMEISLEYDIKNFCVKPVYQDLKASAISIESEVEICAYIYDKIEFDIINDLYSTQNKTNCEYEEIRLLQSNINTTNNIELTQSLLIPDLETLKILNISVKPIFSDINVLDGKLALEGKYEFNILYYKKDKKVIENKKMELPFGQVIKIPELQSNMKVETNVKIEKVESKIVGNNQLQIEMNMDVNVINNEEKVVMVIKNIEVTDEELPNISSIVVYYVKHGDTLWSIAKNFHTTVEEIKNLNGLTDDIIYPNQQLIIQKRKVLKEEVLI